MFIFCLEHIYLIKFTICLKKNNVSNTVNPVESELRDFLSQDNQICKKCDSLNRNIMNNPKLKCWNCDELLNTQNHPTATLDEPLT